MAHIMEGSEQRRPHHRPRVREGCVCVCEGPGEEGDSSLSAGTKKTCGVCKEGLRNTLQPAVIRSAPVCTHVCFYFTLYKRPMEGLEGVVSSFCSFCFVFFRSYCIFKCQ